MDSNHRGDFSGQPAALLTAGTAWRDSCDSWPERLAWSDWRAVQRAKVMSMADDSGGLKIPVAYIGLDEILTLHANQFVVQVGDDECLLTIGQLIPPVLLGTDEEKRQQAKDIPYVSIKALARYAISRRRLGELRDLIEQQLQRHDERESRGP